MDSFFQFDKDRFSRLFPFFILVDRQLNLISFGKTVAQICQLRENSAFTEYFSIHRPETELLSIDSLKALQNQLVILEFHAGEPLLMRGQFEYLEETDSILFVGSPWFYSMDQVRARQLTLHDFANHDPMVDLLHVLKTQEIVNEDIKALLETVNRQRNELKQFSLVAEQTAHAVIMTDKHGKIEWVNHAFFRNTGYALEEVKGKRPGDFLQGPDTDPATIRYLQEQITKGEAFHCELINYHKDGHTYWVDLAGLAIRDKSGDIQQYFAIQDDITPRKKLELEIKSSANQLSTLVANINAAVLLEDENRNIRVVNQHFCDMFDIPATPEQLAGCDCSRSANDHKNMFVGPEDFIVRIDELLHKQQTVLGDRLEMVDGRVLSRDFIPTWNENIYQGHLWVYTDITETERTQHVIKESEERYRGIIENMELGLLEVDLNQTILQPNQAFCDMLGYKPEELIGRNAVELLLPKHYVDEMKARDSERKTGKSSVYEIQVRKRDGSLMWVMISGAPIKNNKGEVTGSLGIHFDLTKRKNLEIELAAAKQNAEMARFAERHFLANMSHEIRTPMNSVIGMTHLLYDTNPTPLQKEYLDSLRFSSDSLMGLIDDILDISKIEVGQLMLEERTFDLLHLLESMQRSFQFKVQDKAISVVMQYDPEIANCVVGDPTRLGQILTNLLGNASKFTSKGTIGVQTTLLQQTEAKYLIEFRVFDTGIGIPQNKQEEIFDYFKQADVQVTRKFGGSGLGLSIVKQLVELQGGQIRVESEVGRGSTFIFTLPFKKTDSKVAERGIKHEMPDKESLQALKDLNVLIAEDNGMNQKLLSRLLINWGCHFKMASNGLEAVRLAGETPYDLILMDIHMPEMDGCEAALEIRQNPDGPNAHTPIIALTAAALQEEKIRAVEAGMNEFITKPYSPQMLQKVMLKAMGYTASASKSATSEPGLEVEINLQYLHDLGGGDPHFMQDMIETYLAETPPALEKLHVALAAQDWEQVYRIVHKLKPNFGMLGMKAQQEKALEIEQRIKASQADPVEFTEMITWLELTARQSFDLLRQKLAQML